jgi:hypothetical protein
MYGKTTFERERDRIAKSMKAHRARLAVRTQRMQEMQNVNVGAVGAAQEYHFNEAFNINNYGLQAAPAQQQEWQNEILERIDEAEDDLDEDHVEFNEDEDER